MRQHVIIEVSTDSNRHMTRTLREETYNEAIEREQREDDIKKASDYHSQHALPLYCEVCRFKIGLVYANDLEGSYFYCEKCASLGMPRD